MYSFIPFPTQRAQNVSLSVDDQVGRRKGGGLDVIRKEARPFYRTISGVRLYWVLEEPKGPTACDHSPVMARVRQND